MAEPLAHPGTAGEGLLADAAHRLDRALQVLEAAIGGGRPAASSTSLAEGVELETARRRNRELETAAAEASHTLGRAMAHMEQALQDDEPATQNPQASLFEPGLFEPGLFEPGLFEPGLDADLQEELLPDADRFDSALESRPGLADHQHETDAAGPAPHEEPTE